MGFQCVSRNLPFFVEDARLSVLKLFHALRWSKPRCWWKNTTGFTNDWTQQPGLATRWSCGRFRFWDFLWEGHVGFLGVNVQEHQHVSVSVHFFVAKLLGICELEVKVMWAALLAIQQGFPAPPKQHQQKHASTLNFAERWWKRWIASGWLGVLPYVRTRAWYKNENKIALVIVSGPCDPSGIVM